MKLTTITASFALLALTACSADESLVTPETQGLARTSPSEGDLALSLNVNGGDDEGDSRVTLITSSNVKNQRYKLHAHDTNTGSMFIDRMPLFWNNTQWYLNSTAEQYYANSRAAYEFFAWGPYTGNGGTLYDNQKIQEEHYYSGSTTSQVVTLTGFKVPAKKTDQVDILVGADRGPVKSGDKLKVTLNMRHALAQLRFHFYVGDPVLEYEIIGFRLTQFYSEGNIAFMASNFTDASNPSLLNLDKAWSNWKTPVDYYFKFNNKVTIQGAMFYLEDRANHKWYSSGTVNALDIYNEGYMTENILVVPVNYPAPGKNYIWNGSGSNANGARLTLLCKISTLDRGLTYDKMTRTQIYPKSGTGYSYVSVPFNVKITGGVRNDIYVNLSGGGRVDPDLTDPDGVFGTTVVSNTTTLGKEKGELVLNSDISFTVNYQEWYIGDDEKSVLGEMEW